MPKDMPKVKSVMVLYIYRYRTLSMNYRHFIKNNYLVVNSNTHSVFRYIMSLFVCSRLRNKVYNRELRMIFLYRRCG